MCLSRRKGLTLLETLALAACLAVLLVFFLRPRVTHCGLLNTKLVCAANLKGIGTSCKIYANENNESWPTPPFNETTSGGIDYTVRVGGGEGSVRSPNRLQPSLAGVGGARQLSVTRALWILVRSGDITPKYAICPQSGMKAFDEPSLDEYYDFPNAGTVSYGFQVPFGPEDTRASERSDNRMPLAADRGPYLTPDVAVPPLGLKRYGPGLRRQIEGWRSFNSPNHGGDGQNVLFADGHVSFIRVPTVGIDGDNIYTIARNLEQGIGRVGDESPWARSVPPASSTDSVIFP